jgi:hypothetical protein
MSLSGSGEYFQYTAKVEYELKACLYYPSLIPLVPSRIVAVAPIPNFIVYDPRILLNMMNPIERKWKSHVNAIPFEYDIGISSSAFGPGDELGFYYRILVNEKFARFGIRVLRVSLHLLESHVVGEDRCCRIDDQKYVQWGHGYPKRVRGAKELFVWSNVEYPTEDSRFSDYQQPPSMPMVYVH